MNKVATVFVIDDDHAVRAALELLLRLEQVDAEFFASAEEFFEGYEQGRPGCLLLDVNMPGLDGLELQRILRESGDGLPVIFITGHGDVAMAGQAFKAGAFDFIEKPFDSGFLLERIREAIEHDWRQRRSDAIAAWLQQPLSLDPPKVEENEWAAVTLHAIGEAVITTDACGVVEYLNPMAESLTGWSDHEARGQPLERVFNVIDEFSRKPVETLISHCLRQEGECRSERQNLLLTRDGMELAVEETLAPIRGSAGELLGMVVAFKDVTAQRRFTRELLHRAEHDALTGLVNRREFERRLEHAIAASRSHGAVHSLCYLDLDQFKVVNDTVGHGAGDELLRQIATLMMAQVRDRDTLARLGGDEFALLLTNCPVEKALDIARALQAEMVDFRFVWGERTFQVGVSIGVVPVTGVAGSVTELLTQADAACYSAKRGGSNRIHLCKREAGAEGRRQSGWVRASSLASALEQERFLLYGQPVVPLAAGVEPLHQELLVRLLGSEGEVVLPHIFIPTAERYGLMAAIDRWVIRTALQRYPVLAAAMGGAGIAINLSGKSLADATLPRFVRQQLGESRLAPQLLCFEISETALIQNFNQARHFIFAMKDEGCCIALDDFGSGISSFSHLRKLPVDHLKIHGSYVQGMLHNPVDAALVEAINKIGHTLSLRTVAKCAESEAQIDRLRALGVDYAQGNGICSPCSLA